MQQTYTFAELLERITVADDEDSVRALLMLFEEEKDLYSREELNIAYHRLLGRIQYLYGVGKLKY